MRKKFLVVAAVLAACVALVGGTPAGAGPGGNSATSTSTLQTIGVAAIASDNSVCSQITVFGGLQAWQCSPVLVATANAFQPAAKIGGSVTWSGFARCEYRKMSDGLDNAWTSWTSCGPIAKSGEQTSSWPLLSNPTGGSIYLTWPQIQNVDTWGATDCVEIRTYVSSSAQARSPIETVSAFAKYPPFGDNVSGICEGNNAY